MSAARATLAHPEAIQQVSTVPSGPRSGTLATADPRSHTVVLYVRSCSAEPTAELAVAWMYEAGQFVDVGGWDASTRDRWRQLRGDAAVSSTGQLRQDVAAVFAYWQTGTDRWWQSPVPPPDRSRLPEFAPFLHLS